MRTDTEAIAELGDESGLSLLYIGPESVDDEALKRIAKGASFADHVEAARRAHAANMKLSVIFCSASAERNGAKSAPRHPRT